MKISVDQREVILTRAEVKMALARFIRSRWPRPLRGGSLAPAGAPPDLSLIELWEFRIPCSSADAEQAIIAKLP